MHSKTFPRYLGGAWRLLLCALLVATLGPVAARAAGGFTDIAGGLPAGRWAGPEGRRRLGGSLALPLGRRPSWVREAWRHAKANA